MTSNQILVYAINLRGRQERREHIIHEFEGKAEFEFHLFEACEHTKGAVGLWNSMVNIIQIAKDRKEDMVIICEDDHYFTEHYSAELLLREIKEAREQGAEILSGGIGGFGQSIPAGPLRHRVDWFWCTQFIVVYASLFDKILTYIFKENDTADGVLSEIAYNKMVIYPFISEQRDFGYSDVTLNNMNNRGLIREHFAWANEQFKALKHERQLNLLPSQFSKNEIMKDSNTLQKAKIQLVADRIPDGVVVSSPFMGNFFCKIDNYNLEFITIAKNASTYLRHLAIYAKTGQVAETRKQVHTIVGYSSSNGYLVPVHQPCDEGVVRFAVWQDPVERLVSVYKCFCLERNIRTYFLYLDLYRNPSFERFLEFVRFELSKSDAMYQDEHLRRQSDYYSPKDVDYIVHIDKLDMFLREFNVPLIKGNANYTHAKFELTDKALIDEIKELYQSDYQIKPNY